MSPIRRLASSAPWLATLALTALLACGEPQPDDGAGPDATGGDATAAGTTDTAASPSGAADPSSPAAAPEPSGAALDPQRPGWRPNVVLYLVDTLRADRLGLYGHTRDTSPTLDAIGAQAAVFERAYSQGPWTLPAVVSLFTSAYPTSHEMLSATFSLDDSAVTLAEWFAEQGYATAGFVHNTLGGKGSHLDQGYEHFVEKPPERDLTDAMRAAGLHTMRPMREFVEGYAGARPFFMYVHTVEPHWPYEGKMPDREPWTDADPSTWGELNDLVYEQRVLWQQRSAEGLSDEEAARLAEVGAQLEGRLDDVWALYDADVHRADVNLRRIALALQQAGHWDDTVFLFLSDHGEEFLEHGLWFHDQSLFEELVRVPFVLRVPGLTEGGLRIDTPVQLVDVAPTLADLLGQPPLPHWQGRSLVPLLRDPSAGADWPPALSMRRNVDRPMGGARGDNETAIVTDAHKLVIHHDHDEAWLFDLGSDPTEQRDVSAEQPERAEALRHALESRVRTHRPLDIREAGELSDEKLRHLQELGYVEGDG